MAATDYSLQIVLGLIAIIPGILAYVGGQRTKKKVGDITETMTEGFRAGAQPVNSFQAVIEMQSAEIRRIREAYDRDADEWSRTEKVLRDEVRECRIRNEELIIENVSLKSRLKEHGLSRTVD